MNIIIRHSKESDIKKILELMNLLGYSLSVREFKKLYKNFLKQNNYGIVVAEHENNIAGWIAWSTSLLFVSPKTRIHIEGIVVDPKYRGKGIGQKLIKYLENYAKNFSLCIIDLTSGTRREKDGSHEFYKKLGYKNEGYFAKLYLRKEL